MIIVALDPGTTTGIAVYDGETWARQQLGPKRHHELLMDVLDEVMPHVVVSEDFNFQPRRTKIILDSVEYIGVTRLWCAQNGTRLVMQGPALGKKFWDDKKIRDLGLWIPNMPHAMDATRHLLFYWMRNVDNRHVESLKGD